MFFKKSVENATLTTIDDYIVATKNNGTKTSTDSVSKNSFLTYICTVQYKNESANDIALIKYLYGSKSYHTIPGLKTTNVLGFDCNSMVPQGICRMDGYVLISSYDYDKKCNSVIYVLSADKASLCATLVYPSKSHVGGMAYDGSYLYVCNSTQKTVSAFAKSYLLEAIHLSIQHNLNSIGLSKYTDLNVKTTASYCTYYDGRLWVGVFNSKDTDDIFGYRIVGSSAGSELMLKADRYIQAPQYAQGITFYKGKYNYFVVSCSWGKRDSSLRCYKLKDYEEPKIANLNGITQVKKGDAYKIISMPNRAEQVLSYEGKMYLAFESGASVYSSVFHGETDCYLVLDIAKVLS